MTLPSTIAHYRIISKIGEGGMGSVYRATDTKLNRAVAIKILPDAFAGDADRLARFTRESQVLASLNHPNIAAIYGVEERALVMELVAGASPAGPLTPEQVLPLVNQLIEALEYAHERGIVHRDLKPANIIVTPEGTLKLLDFGLAKAIETTQATAVSMADSPTLTIAASLPGVIMGTAGYMSPEQARGAKVDHRTDIWAFGAVLYELLTGKQAFPGDTVSDTLASILRSDPDFTLVPARFRPLVERCLARDLKRRLGWIGDARMLLDAPAVAAPVVRARAFQKAGLVAAIVVAAAAGFAVSRFLSTAPAPARLPAMKITRVTTGVGSWSPTVSADGKLVAYVARREGRQTLDIWIQQVGGGAAIRLTDDTGVVIWSSPVFSADTTKVYYYSTREPGGIYEVPVLGGEPRLAIAGMGIIGLRPSPDGRWLAYLLDGKLLLRPTEGGDPRVLLPQPGIPAAWSPDSARIFALIMNTGFEAASGIFSVPVDGSSPTRLGDLWANLRNRGFSDLNLTRFAAWLPGGDIIFNARYGDATNLWRIPLARLGDAMPSAVTLGPWASAMASVRGNHMVFANLRNTNQVWRLAVDMNSGKVNGAPERVTEDLIDAQFPDVRPDNSALVYVSRRMGAQSLFLMDPTTHRDRLLHQAGVISSAYSTFSPDGSQVAFGQGGAGWPAFTVPSTGGDVKPIGNAEGRIRGWTRDGRYLLVWRVPPGKPTTIGLLELSTSRPLEIMRAAKELGSPRLSPDNRWLAFQMDNGQRSSLWIAPFRGATSVPESEWIQVAQGVNPFWSPDSRTLYFARYPGGSVDATMLLRQPLDPASGRPTSPATELYRLEGDLDTRVINTPTASSTHLYFLLRGGMSEIWMMDLPQ